MLSAHKRVFFSIGRSPFVEALAQRDVNRPGNTGWLRLGNQTLRYTLEQYRATLDGEELHLMRSPRTARVIPLRMQRGVLWGYRAGSTKLVLVGDMHGSLLTPHESPHVGVPYGDWALYRATQSRLEQIPIKAWYDFFDGTNQFVTGAGMLETPHTAKPDRAARWFPATHLRTNPLLMKPMDTRNVTIDESHNALTLVPLPARELGLELVRNQPEAHSTS